MNKETKTQMKFAQVSRKNIEIDLRSTDEIQTLLLGLQHIYCTHEMRQEVFAELEIIVPEGVDKKKGRPGM